MSDSETGVCLLALTVWLMGFGLVQNIVVTKENPRLSPARLPVQGRFDATSCFSCDFAGDQALNLRRSEQLSAGVCAQPYHPGPTPVVGHPP